MDWKDLPSWRLTWVNDNKALSLKVDKNKRPPKTTELYHSESIIFYSCSVNEKIVGYTLVPENPDYQVYDHGWYVCLFFAHPEETELQCIYEDKNVRLVKVGSNYTFALRWKQS